MKEYEILDVHAVEILDSRGLPTVDVTITLKDGITGNASIPGGNRIGQYEAVELRDGDKRHLGKGVEQAVTNVNTRIADKIIGMNVLEQVKIDQLLIQADGTENKRKYGANAIAGVSVACARAAANALGIPLYQYIGGVNTKIMPIPMMSIINGGRHMDRSLDVQDIMIVPVGAYNFTHAMEISCEIYHHFKEHIKENGYSVSVGDEGGFTPDCKSIDEVLELLMEAIEKAGYSAGKDVMLAFDVGASDLYDENSELYYFEGESRITGKEIYLNAEEMVQYYEEMINKERLQCGIKESVANAILIKYNQIGTLTETLDVIEMAKKAGYRTIISHRTGETEDPLIGDLAVAVNAEQIKAGAPCRSDRTAKYNRLLKIEEQLGKTSEYNPDFLTRRAKG